MPILLVIYILVRVLLDIVSSWRIPSLHLGRWSIGVQNFRVVWLPIPQIVSLQLFTAAQLGLVFPFNFWLSHFTDLKRLFIIFVITSRACTRLTTEHRMLYVTSPKRKEFQSHYLVIFSPPTPTWLISLIKFQWHLHKVPRYKQTLEVSRNVGVELLGRSLQRALPLRAWSIKDDLFTIFSIILWL